MPGRWGIPKRQLIFDCFTVDVDFLFLLSISGVNSSLCVAIGLAAEFL